MEKKLIHREMIKYLLIIVLSWMMIAVMSREKCMADEREVIGYGELDAEWVNLGLNWEMTGGTSGRVVKGETFDVFERRMTDKGYRYYVYAHNAKIYGYISERFIIFKPVITTKDLFEKYSKYLDNPAFEEKLNNYAQLGYDVIENTEKYNEIRAYATTIKEGLSLWWKEALSKVGLSSSYEERVNQEAILQFVLGLHSNTSAIYDEIQKTDAKIANVSDVLDVTRIATKESYIRLIKKLVPEISYSDLYKSWEDIEQRTESIYNIKSNVSDVYNMLVMCIKPYLVENQLIDRLLNNLDPDFILYEDLLMLKQRRMANPLVYVQEYIWSDYLFNELISVVNGGVIALADFTLKTLSNVFYNGANVEDVVNTTKFSMYYKELCCSVRSQKVSILKKRVNGQEISEEDIKEYEFVFSAYIESVKIFLRSAKALGNEKNIEEALQCIESKYKYEDYISSCIQNINQ